MPNKDMNVDFLYEVIQRYECTNRITKAVIRMTRIRFNIGKTNPKTGVYISCQTHKETRNCKNKTEALFQMRQPWIWCDGCAEIHYNTAWQRSLEPSPSDVSVTQDVLMDIKKPADPSLEEDDTCPDCNGSGEVAGDYFSDDGMTTCNRCNGKGVL